MRQVDAHGQDGELGVYLSCGQGVIFDCLQDLGPSYLCPTEEVYWLLATLRCGICGECSENVEVFSRQPKLWAWG